MVKWICDGKLVIVNWFWWICDGDGDLVMAIHWVHRGAKDWSAASFIKQSLKARCFFSTKYHRHHFMKTAIWWWHLVFNFHFSRKNVLYICLLKICKKLYMRKKRKITDEEAFFKGTSVWWNTIKRMHKKKNYEVVFCKN